MCIYIYIYRERERAIIILQALLKVLKQHEDRRAPAGRARARRESGSSKRGFSRYGLLYFYGWILLEYISDDSPSPEWGIRKGGSDQKVT